MLDNRSTFDPDLIRRLDRSGPRYTSYPTADRFVEAFGAEAYRSWAARRNIGALCRPLSLYVHLPFCRNLCFYCACNKIVTRDRGKAGRYLDYLGREIAMQAELFSGDRHVREMHWGGGTPTFYTAGELRGLWSVVSSQFDLAADGEYSIEIDPRTVDADTVIALRELGFNRVSFGVQDFDPAVQAAVHRLQSEEQTLAVIRAARRAGFASINVDLIYGLPRQTTLSFGRTLARIIEARPDRIALYNYAHLPALFKSQRRINPDELPAPADKLALFTQAVTRLAEAGYSFIGMDHFALPTDSLATAQRQGRLRRSFQGYSAGMDCDLVALGVSAIGAIGPTYSQNFRTLNDYYDCIDRGELPIMRGLELSADDLLRRAVIHGLMCQFTLSRRSLEIAYLIDFDRYFATELAELAPYEDLGLVELEDDWIHITPKGRPLVRTLCMVFDRYLRQDRETRRYSRVI